MASKLKVSCSFLSARRCFLLATAVFGCFFLFCLPTMTSAMPIVVEEAVMSVRMEEHQEADHLSQELGHEQEAEGFRQEAEGFRQEAEGFRQEAEGFRQEAEGFRQEAEGFRQEAEGGRRRRAVTECPRPDNITAMFKQINSELNRRRFLGTLYDNQAISISSARGPTYLDEDPNENKTCPTHLRRNSADPLAHRSLCPFYFRTLVLPRGYFPTSLRTARCKCQKCVENTGYGCEAVSVEVAVLKPVGCWQGLQKYEEQTVPVNAGCVCATSFSAAASPDTFDMMTE